MKIVIFGDVHGNIYALDKLFEVEKDADFFICLGDLVGYGPYNDQCLDAIQTVDIVYLKGNHEEMFIEGRYHDSCSNIAKKFFNYSYKNYSKDKYDSFLLSLPRTYQVGDFTCIHTLKNKHIYPNTNLEDLNMEGSYFIGHSHIQFDQCVEGLRVVNVGSLGQNRKNINMGEYGVFDSSKGEIGFRQIKNINIDKFISDLTDQKYDAELIAYYKSKL